MHSVFPSEHRTDSVLYLPRGEPGRSATPRVVQVPITRTGNPVQDAPTAGCRSRAAARPPRHRARLKMSSWYFPFCSSKRFGRPFSSELFGVRQTVSLSPFSS